MAPSRCFDEVDNYLLHLTQTDQTAAMVSEAGPEAEYQASPDLYFTDTNPN